MINDIEYTEEFIKNNWESIIKYTVNGIENKITIPVKNGREIVKTLVESQKNRNIIEEQNKNVIIKQNQSYYNWKEK